MQLQKALQEIELISPYIWYGHVKSVLGLLIEVVGLNYQVEVGSRCRLITRSYNAVEAEVIGFRGEAALVMPFHSPEGLGPGCKAIFLAPQAALYPTETWLGRVLNGLGQPVDGQGPLEKGDRPYHVRRPPPSAHGRRRVGPPLDLGIRAINLFATCCLGQRMGIFAGSGVGKSVLLSMIARFTAAEVIVIGLVGERGREVQEFIEEYLGPEGLARSVVVVATSDEAPMMRRQAAYTAITIAEYYADQGREVLCMMDSVTRFAMAQREIGLSMGEPPASKGYTPTVFAELPKLLERAGPGTGKSGNITGIFTVLVEGDDHNEPIADAVRGILDGHIVLERSIAERGRFPAMNLLRSVSRTMPDCNPPEHTRAIISARRLMAVYEDMADMIRLGAYRIGTDPEVDDAVAKVPSLLERLNQGKEERGDFVSSLESLNEVLDNARPS